MNQSAATTSFTSASQEDISQRARELWESYGRPDGRDTEIWLEAERQLLGADAKVQSSGDTAVSAEQFDETTSHDKPRTRMTKTETTRKPAAADDKITKSAKTPAPAPAKSAVAAKPASLSKTGGSKTATKAASIVRPKR